MGISLFLQLKKETPLKKSNVFTPWDGQFRIQRRKGQNNLKQSPLSENRPKNYGFKTKIYFKMCLPNLKIIFSSVYETFVN